MVVHNIPPVFDRQSEVLILGSFPSVKSREAAFFYGHPQNRFWRVIAAVYGDEPGDTPETKTAFLLRHHVALWDVIGRCEITGSSDASIKNAVPNDISMILSAASVMRIFVNGQTAAKYYRKYLLPQTGREAVTLPSTSPANAAKSLDELIEIWRAALFAEPGLFV
jgi:hypoxanthine-DNA glycosylase